MSVRCNLIGHNKEYYSFHRPARSVIVVVLIRKADVGDFILEGEMARILTFCLFLAVVDSFSSHQTGIALLQEASEKEADPTYGILLPWT